MLIICYVTFVTDVASRSPVVLPPSLLGGVVVIVGDLLVVTFALVTLVGYGRYSGSRCCALVPVVTVTFGSRNLHVYVLTYTARCRRVYHTTRLRTRNPTAPIWLVTFPFGVVGGAPVRTLCWCYVGWLRWLYGLLLGADSGHCHILRCRTIYVPTRTAGCPRLICPVTPLHSLGYPHLRLLFTPHTLQYNRW